MTKKVALTAEAAAELLLKHYGFTVSKICEIIGYDDQNFIVSVKSKEPHQNQYVFKVIDDSESNRKVCQEVSSVLGDLHITGLQIPKPVKTITNHFFHPIFYGETKKRKSLLLHLLSFVPGSTLADVKHGCQSHFNSLAFETGVAIAKIDSALLKFGFREDLKRHDFRWNMSNTKFCSLAYEHVGDEELRKIFMKINETFNEKVMENLHALRSGIIHGDANANNIIINERNEDKTSNSCKFTVTGVIDFSDMMATRLVFEVGTMMAYIMTKARQDKLQPLEAAANALYGYESILPLHKEEKNVLFISIMKRLAVSACSAWLEKSLGAPREILKDLAAVSSVAKEFGMCNDSEILSKLYSIR